MPPDRTVCVDLRQSFYQAVKRSGEGARGTVGNLSAPGYNHVTCPTGVPPDSAYVVL